MPNMKLIRTITWLSVFLLTACGFHLRGEVGMPFKTLYLQAPNQSSPFVVDLRRNLAANHVSFVTTPEQADIILDIASEMPEKQILTLSGAGRVNEFQLRYRVSMRAYDLNKNIWVPAEEMIIRRDYSYDDTKILAKESEEAMLYQSMRTDMVQQLIRRLSRAKPVPEAD
ncbi:MAG: LPS assembly lipoprotein LptE [Gallionella sp.]|nr:LPS assembly lipoprotein LptE [Gallionella sp.]